MQKRVASLASAFVLLTGMVGSLFVPTPALAGYPGANGVLTYKKANGPGPEIRAMNADGTDPHTIVSGSNDECYDSAAWSPDGTKLAYIRCAGELIKIMDANGANAHTIADTSQPYGAIQLAWSPDGLQIAYTDHWDGLYIMNVDGSNRHEILKGYITDVPKWSPDGSRIAFTAWEYNGPGGADRADIMVANADGSDVTDLYANDWGGVDTDPDWAPDGSAIVFVSQGQLWVDPLDGTNQLPITNDSNHVFSNPVWSPDGNSIAMLADDTNPSTYTPEIKRLDMSDLSIHNVATLTVTADHEVYEQLAWQPVTSPFIYRLANWKTHERLFTTNPSEVFSAQSGNSGWVYEGVGFHSAQSSDPGVQPVYRLANFLTHERLFTTSAAEADNAVHNLPGWVNEGTAYYSAPCGAGTQAIYRLANWKTHERLFTTSLAEVNNAVQHLDGWVSEGTAFCEPTL